MKPIISIKNSTSGAYTLQVDYDGYLWKEDPKMPPYIRLQIEGEQVDFLLKDACTQKLSPYKTGFGEGYQIRYQDFLHNNKTIHVTILTRIWADFEYGDIHFDCIPLGEPDFLLEEMMWPAPFVFDTPKASSYTVIPMMQGTLIPNNWKDTVVAVDPVRYYERAAYMPWWGQIDEGQGYQVIVETPWDAGYALKHPSHGPTRIANVWHGSLGRIAYNRKLIMKFSSGVNYVDLCKQYRSYMEERGLVKTLKQKIQDNGKLEQLMGVPIIHTGIYNHIEPASEFYDKEHPEKNDCYTPFTTRKNQLMSLQKRGVQTAYVHVDGWGKMGYDNMHPDVFPPCQKAGGYEGMRELVDGAKEMGYLMAIHDQYRDYYVTAETYDPNQNVILPSGEVPRETMWAGGEQTLLCATFAPYYIRRNYQKFEDNDIHLDGVYLDVFSVVELDECAHPEHPMTRKECMEKRVESFEYLKQKNMVMSSEELVDWAVPHIDLSHHAPYPLTPGIDAGDARGIPVPLFNLVYHDCVVIPWSQGKGDWGIPVGDWGFLHGLLNGGAAYLPIEPTDQEIDRALTTGKLHKKVGKMEMVSHEFLDGGYRKQRTTFSDGTVVEVDFDKDTYSIS